MAKSETFDSDLTDWPNPWPASRFTEAERVVLHEWALAGFRVLDARKERNEVVTMVEKPMASPAVIRQLAATLRGVISAGMQKAPIYDQCVAVMLDAADEIDRLKTGPRETRETS